MSTRKAKYIGTIEPPQDVINMVREKVIVESTVQGKPHKSKFIITTYVCEKSIIIYIGSYDIYCINVRLLKNRVTHTYNMGIMTKAIWDIACSIDEPFEKCASDIIIIIKLMLSYINDKYPHVVQILFTDMSTIECDNNEPVNLSAMNIFTEGKTWYESYFDVSIDEMIVPLNKIILNDADKRKSEMTFDNFIGFVAPNDYLPIPITKDELRELYDNTTTWQEFFYPIYKLVGFYKFGVWLGVTNWFNLFIKFILNASTIMYQQLIFTPKQYDINYTITKNMSSSGRYRITLKRR